MSRILHIVTAALLGVMAGCARETSTFTITHFTPSGETPNLCVEFSMEAPTQVAPGTGLSATLIAENICTETIKLPLGYNIHHDLLVTDLNGEVLWQSLHGQVRILVQVQKFLEPGERLTFEANWSGRDNRGGIIPPGTYQLVGILFSEKMNEEVYTPEGQNFEAIQTLEVGF